MRTSQSFDSGRTAGEEERPVRITAFRTVFLVSRRVVDYRRITASSCRTR